MAVPAVVARGGQTDAGPLLLLLDRAGQEVRRLGRADLAERMDSERQRFLDPACHVLVIGEFKKGKSALINALLNHRVCAVDADVATAIPTLVRYAARPSATVITEKAGARRGDDPDPPRERRAIPLAAVQAFATERVTERVDDRVVHSVEVQIPRQLLRDGLVLVDTPGVGGGMAAAHAGATLRALTMADAVVFVSDASQEYTATEVEFLRQAGQLCPYIVCVLTKTDFYPQWRRIHELDRGHLRDAGLDYELIPLAAPLRHHAVRTGDRALDIESGYPFLADYLRTEVVARKELLTAGAAVAAVQQGLQHVLTRVATEHATLRDPAAAGRLLQDVETARKRTERLRGGAARWRQTMDDRFGDMVSNVETDLAMRLRRVRREAQERIAAADPASTWSELRGWLTERVNEELVVHYLGVRTEAQAVAGLVSRHFDEDDPQVALDVDLDSPHGDLSRVQVVTDLRVERLSRLQLGGAAVRGSASSMVLTSMIGTFVSVAAPYLLPVTAVLALAMATRAAKGARQAQLQANRTLASRAVAAYLDDAELVARKDTRDTLRRTGAQLRDHFTRRAEELYVTAVANQEAVVRAAQTGSQTRDQRIQQTAADVQRLHALLDAADRVAGNLARAQA